MRDHSVNSGPSPRTCRECRESHKGEGWCSHHTRWEPSSNFNDDAKTGRPKGKCKSYYNEARAARMNRPCRLCGVVKNVKDFRRPGGGAHYPECAECRRSRSDVRYCHPHGEYHPASDFYPGEGSRCKAITRSRNWDRNSRGLMIECVACGDKKQSLKFAGMGKKSHICLECEESHPNEGWCLGHSAWMPLTSFHARGRRWCAACKMAGTHNTTVEHLMKLNGSKRPECGACGATADLCVDHDHSHCPGAKGCQECVRGYLCQGCNIAEGRLRTPERARALAIYMERHSR